MANEILYFSTKVELKMNGVIYRPAMCYAVPPFARKSLQPFVDAGKVTFHNEPVHFVNGAIAHITKEVQTPVNSVIEEIKPVKKKVD